MSANSRWPGIVSNKSSNPVWVIWDEGEDDAHKKWFAKPLAAGRRSPKGLDIDGVCAYLEGMRIASLTWRGAVDKAISDWWWLVRGAEVTIKDGFAMQTIVQTSTLGTLKVVADSEVCGWVPSWLDLELEWGTKL
ncbi:MAG TPA: hypothetical protein VGF55_27235 [Gemmataceae bacterium]|jgi:hypothetical protein